MSAHHGVAFGLDIESDFEVLGLDAVERTYGHKVQMVRVGRDAIPPPAGAPLAEVRSPGGSFAASVGLADGGGYLLRASTFGHAWVSTDGSKICCAPVDAPSSRWQRFLTGQVLPLAALLSGHEVFHASAVVVGPGAVAVVAGSGIGKTTIALNLVLSGAGFLTDDVLAVEPTADGVVAHSGPAVANVSADQSDLAERVIRRGLGQPIDVTRNEVRISPRRHAGPLPLRALFFVERVASGGIAEVMPVDPVEPRLLLGSSFIVAIRNPDRLTRLLDVCARVAAASRMFKVLVPNGSAPEQTAVAIQSAAAAASVL